MHENRLLVFIGDRDTPATATNPLPFEARKAMVKEHFPDAYVVRIMDHQDDKIWSENLDKMIGQMVGEHPVTFYVGRDSFKSHYFGKYKVTEVPSIDGVNATALRKKVGKKFEDNTEFRKGVIWAMQNLTPRIYLCVDMVLARYRFEPEICLVRRPQATQWQLPGGHVEIGESLAQAAAREMQEETHTQSQAGWEIVGDYTINDWRIRDAAGTVGYKSVLMYGVTLADVVPKGDDDIEEAKFFPTDLVEMYLTQMIKPNHLEVVKAALRTIAERGGRYYLSRTVK